MGISNKGGDCRAVPWEGGGVRDTEMVGVTGSQGLATIPQVCSDMCTLRWRQCR